MDDTARGTAQVPYTCRQCGKIVYSFTKLRQHNRRFHSALAANRRFGCAYCLRYCFHKGDLITHLRIHTYERPFKCVYCDETFGSTTARGKHVSACHVTTKWFGCSRCLSYFDDRRRLHDHILSHYNGKRTLSLRTSTSMHCQFCGLLFKRLLQHQLLLHSEFGTISCFYCPKRFFSDEQKYAHESSVHRTSKFLKCPHCERRFYQTRELSQHVAKFHVQDLKYACRFCGKGFALRYDRILHEKRHVETFPCGICEKRFTTLAAKNLHSRIHSGTEPYACDHCGRKFLTRSVWSRHVTHVHGNAVRVKEFGCSHCEVRFHLQHRLIEHLRLHTGEKPFKCQQCDESFYSKSSLRLHKRFHDNGVRAYCCHACRQSFSTALERKAHLLTHRQLPAIFSCSLCSKKFISTHSLRVHTRRKHQSVAAAKVDTGVQCRFCFKKFANYFLKLKHERFHDGSSWALTCKTCGRRFEVKRALLQHEQSHLASPAERKDATFACKFCDAVFDYEYDRRKHVFEAHSGVKLKCEFCPSEFWNKELRANHMKRQHAEQMGRPKIELKCEFCPKLFNSISNKLQHERAVHKGERPYVCEFCDKSFGYPGQKKSHVKDHHHCGICVKAFRTKEEKTAHMQSSHGVVPEKRKKRTVYNHGPRIGPKMPRHVRVPCTVCGRRLSRSTLGHWLSHSHDKSDATITFEGADSTGPTTSSESCDKGERSEQAFKCSFCESSFALLREINVHIWSKHPETFGQTNFMATGAIPVSSPKKITSHRRRSSAVCISELVDSVASEAAAKAADSLVMVAKVTDSHTEVSSISTNGLPVDSSAACGSTLADAVVVSEAAVYAINEGAGSFIFLDSGSDVEIISDGDDGIPAVDLLTMPSPLRLLSSILSETSECTSTAVTSATTNSGPHSQDASIQRQHSEPNYPYPNLFALLAVPQKESCHYSAVKTGSPKKPALQTLSSVLSETSRSGMGRAAAVQQYQNNSHGWESDHTYSWRAPPNESCHLSATASALEVVGRQDQLNNSSFGQQPDHVYWPRALTASLTARPSESNNRSATRESFCITKTAIVEPDNQRERSIRPKRAHPVELEVPVDFSSADSLGREYFGGGASLTQQASASVSQISSGSLVSLSSTFSTFEARCAALDGSPAFLQRCIDSAKKRGSGFNVASSLNQQACASGSQNISGPSISLSSNFPTLHVRRATEANSSHLDSRLGYLEPRMNTATTHGSGFSVASATSSNIPSRSRVPQISSTILTSMCEGGIGGGIARSEGTSVLDLAPTMALAEEIVTDPFISPFS